MSDQILKELKSRIPAEYQNPNPQDRMGGPWTYAGIRIESFPMYAECLARAFELKSAGERVGLVCIKGDA
jgi:hypothetical protein